MESLQKNIRFRLNDEKRYTDIQSQSEKVKQLPGVDKVFPGNDWIIIYYDPYSVSEKFLVKCLSGLGFAPASEKKKGFFARWVEVLAKNNQKTFGNQRLDCCNVKRI